MPLVLDILGKMRIAIVSSPGCVDFEINLIFIIEQFFLHDKNLNLLKTKKAFKVE